MEKVGKGKYQEAEVWFQWLALSDLSAAKHF